MKIKTYQGRSMSEALAKVKQDLGPNAIILHTRTVQRGGILGMGARNVIEIAASSDARVAAVHQASRDRQRADDGQPAVTAQGRSAMSAYGVAGANGTAVKDEPLVRATPNSKPERGAVGGLRGLDDSGVARNAIVDRNETRESLSRSGGEHDSIGENGKDSSLRMANSSRSVRQNRLDSIDIDVPEMPASRLSGGGLNDESAMRQELNEIRAMVRELVDRADRNQYPDAPEELLSFYTHLIGQEVEEQLARDLLNRVSRNLGVGNGRSRNGVAAEMVRMELGRLVGEMLPTAAPLRLTRTDRPTVVALVGPTGVGKTTTIAKLAANMKLREKKNVGLITIDSYRIAAVEQLKTYAQILKVPLVSVLKPEDMAAALERMSNLDLVLIDTAGRSQRDDLRIAELSRFLRVARPDQIHLVLSSTSREKTTRETIERFAPLGVTQLIFTKVDEAVGMGVILNVLRRVKLNVSYLTHGQAVPDDIEVASASRLANLILGFNGHGSSSVAARNVAVGGGR